MMKKSTDANSFLQFNKNAHVSLKSFERNVENEFKILKVALENASKTGTGEKELLRKFAITLKSLHAQCLITVSSNAFGAALEHVSYDMDKLKVLNKLKEKYFPSHSIMKYKYLDQFLKLNTFNSALQNSTDELADEFMNLANCIDTKGNITDLENYNKIVKQIKGVITNNIKDTLKSGPWNYFKDDNLVQQAVNDALKDLDKFLKSKDFINTLINIKTSEQDRNIGKILAKNEALSALISANATSLLLAGLTGPAVAFMTFGLSPFAIAAAVGSIGLGAAGFTLGNKFINNGYLKVKNAKELAVYVKEAEALEKISKQHFDDAIDIDEMNFKELKNTLSNGTKEIELLAEQLEETFKAYTAIDVTLENADQSSAKKSNNVASNTSTLNSYKPVGKNGNSQNTLKPSLVATLSEKVEQYKSGKIKFSEFIKSVSKLCEGFGTVKTSLNKQEQAELNKALTSVQDTLKTGKNKHPILNNTLNVQIQKIEKTIAKILNPGMTKAS
ncbi:MAG: hypothetical protein J0H68_03210 [Sphingobacteriia bacterium]|nr:hypothetical protein [Sphingobacteriia bacterium]